MVRSHPLQLLFSIFLHSGNEIRQSHEKFKAQQTDYSPRFENEGLKALKKQNTKEIRKRQDLESKT